MLAAELDDPAELVLAELALDELALDDSVRESVR